MSAFEGERAIKASYSLFGGGCKQYPVAEALVQLLRGPERDDRVLYNRTP